MTDDKPSASAGWYPDQSGTQRYWDGSAWLDIPAPATSSVAEATAPRPARRRTWIIAAVVVGVLVLGGAGGIAWKASADAQAAQAHAAAVAAER